MQKKLNDLFWTIVFFGLAFLVAMKWHWTRALWMLFYVRPIKGKAASEEWAHQTAIVWGKEIVERFPLWNVALVGSLDKYKEGNYIFVANHESYLDILAMYLSRLSFRWLSKKSNFRIPIVGFWMRCAGYVSVDKGDPIQRKRSLELLRELLQRKRSVFIFPEGTRSKTGELQDFKLGAFKLAVEERIPIAPIVFSGSGRLMKAGSFIPKKGYLKIYYGDPIFPNDGESAEELALRVRNTILEIKKTL